MMDIKRTIEEYLDLETGEVLRAAAFFQQPFDRITQMRSELEKANQGLRPRCFVCAVCGGNIRILGGKSKTNMAKTINFHFAHLHNSSDCPIKTSSSYSKADINRMKYRGLPESQLHIQLKDRIAQGLHLNQLHKGQVAQISLEKVIRSLDEAQWKKPDINVRFNEKHIAIELQLSTTWLDVIVSRQHFYKEAGIYILWIFNLFNTSDDFRKLTYSDIIYTNNYNAFIIDQETYEATIQKKDLVLKCWYQHYFADRGRLRSKWLCKQVTLDELIFDQVSLQVYYQDVRTTKAKVEKEIADALEAENEKQRQIRLELDRRITIKRGLSEDINELENAIRIAIQMKEKAIRQQQVLGKNLNEFNEKQCGVLKTAESLYQNIDALHFYGSLPEAVLEIVKAYRKKMKGVGAELSAIKKASADVRQRQSNYRSLEQKRIGQQVYQILDKVRHREYIADHTERLFTFRTDQPADLFTAPKIQPLNKHQLDQIRFNAHTLVLVNFEKEIGESNAVVLAADEQIEKLNNAIALDKKQFLNAVAQGLANYYQHQACLTAAEMDANNLVMESLDKMIADKELEKGTLEKQLSGYTAGEDEYDYDDDYL